MADKSWMLNPKAIRYANECIQLIREKEGVRLKLSQADFLQQLHGFVERIRSKQLGESYAQLIAMAGVGNVVRSLEAGPAQAVIAQPMAVGSDALSISEEMVQVEGGAYPRYRNGREFQGLFRGVPRYR